MRLRDFLDVAKLTQIYVETEGLDYEVAFEKAKEKLSSDRVAAHKSDNNDSKTYNDSITEVKEIRK